VLKDSDLVSVQEVRAKVEAAWQAWQKYRLFSQEQVDAIVEAVGAAGRENAVKLAEMAVAETGMGNAPDKTAKNLLNSDLLVRSIRGMKTLGLLKDDLEKKVIEIGYPVGVVAAILPTTNPTSTVNFKSIISLKAGNAVVISPHPRAKNSTCAAADVLHAAAIRAGAPEGIIQCVHNASLEGTNALMKHEKTAIILATGGAGMVRAAYSSGKPALGVGPGNVPILVDISADIAEAIAKVVNGKSFDYGTVCSSEQTVVAEQSLREPILAALRNNGAYLCNAEQAAALSKILVREGGAINAECVGQAPGKIARMAGFEVPASTRILVAEIHGVGKEHPLSAEKLSPVLAVYFVPDFNAAAEACEKILHFGGLGHTSVIHAKDDARIRQFGLRMPSFRVLVNTSSPQGSVGITTNLQPSMTLGCGAIARNSTSDNVGPQHLINIKRIAYIVRTPEEALPLPAAAPAAVAAPAAGAPAPSNIVAAVERYLAQRGLAKNAPVTRSVTEEVVDRFLAARRSSPPPAPSPAPSCQSCACSKPPETVPAAPPPPAPEPPIADFVCEQDVRDAMRQNKKIFIGPKTIVTPSAREIGAASDTLVQAKR
jgi:acetaldehyde dehydrogenase (acetylating)